MSNLFHILFVYLTFNYLITDIQFLETLIEFLEILIGNMLEFRNKSFEEIFIKINMTVIIQKLNIICHNFLLENNL